MRSCVVSILSLLLGAVGWVVGVDPTNVSEVGRDPTAWLDEWGVCAEASLYQR